jgi:hypothetical protein
MHIEDLIIALATSSPASAVSSDFQIIDSLFNQIIKGYGFTEKQELLSVRLLKRHMIKINLALGKNIAGFLENPTFRLGRRTVSYVKRISIVPDQTHGKLIKMEFPYNEPLLTKIRKEKISLNLANWDPEQKSWIFSLDERSLRFLSTIAIEENFVVDDEFENYQNQIFEIEQNVEQHIPMLSYDGENLKFLNISEKIGQPANSNILENLFLARKLGIFTWDDAIQDSPELKNANSVTRQFLQVAPDEEFSVNLENIPISALTDIVKHLSPTLFIIPGGTEIEKMQLCYDFLKSIDVANEDISVLFRLPKETGENFNNFVKEHGLNNPIGQTTKAVFISSKVPKPVIESNLFFNSVVNFNFYNIHYSIKNLLKWKHNVIHISEKTQQRKLNFANL